MKDIDNSLAKLLEAKKNLDDILQDSGGKIVGTDLVDLSTVLASLAKKHELMLRDIVTGLYRTPFDIRNKLGKTSERDAQQLWTTYFKDRIRVVHNTVDGTKFKKVTGEDLNILWHNVSMFSTYNSREEMFNAIPEWDGVERIKYFMKKQFECDTNPNFFLLFMTAVIGKMHNPETAYVPYFFDFVSESKGTGKTTLFKHLFGDEYVIEGKMHSRTDDFFVDAYDHNALVDIDDECSWTDNKKPNHISNDDFKSLVTATTDTYSRKFGQPETHYRAFVIVRTSNDVKTVFSTNERRQIIFNINLEENECRHWNLSDEYIEQLKAEAKAYYLEHGVYKLNKDEEDYILKQNMANYSSETSYNFAILNFVRYMRNRENTDRTKYLLDIDKQACKLPDNSEWIGWRSYELWRKDNHEVSIDSRIFNRALVWLSVAHPSYIQYTKRQYKLKDCSTMVKAGRLLKANEQHTDLFDIPDVED